MPTQQGIRRNNSVELDQSLSSDSFGLACEKNPFCVGKPNTTATQPLFEQSVLSLKEFDDDQLMAMNPTSGDHQQKRQQWWPRAHAAILPPLLVRNFGHHAIDVLTDMRVFTAVVDAGSFAMVADKLDLSRG